MKTEDILLEWKKDTQFDRNDISNEAIRLSNLHAKYLEIYYIENARLISSKNELNKMKRLRTEYWLGKTDQETLLQYNWPPNNLLLTKGELPLYMDSDEVLQSVETKHELLKQRVSVLDNIIKHITNRGYNIKTVVEYEKWKSGQ